MSHTHHATQDDAGLGRVRRLPRLLLAAILVATGLAAGLGTMALATGANDTVHYACVIDSSGAMRLVGEGDTCRSNETQISWNAQGPKGDQGDKGDKGDTGDQGDPGLVWQGEWDREAEYAVDDAVSYEGSSYVAVEGHMGRVPDESEEWSLLAQKGDKGDTGDTGERGLQGLPGPAGPSGVSQAYSRSVGGFTYLKLANWLDTEHHTTVAQLTLPAGNYVLWLNASIMNVADFFGQDNSRHVSCYFSGRSTIGYPTTLGGLMSHDNHDTLAMHDVVSIASGGGTVEVKCFAWAASFIGDDSKVSVSNAVFTAIQVDRIN
jgi:hypothetical protein